MDVKFIDTSDWQILRWLSSGGTREKRILQDANDSKWYFKCSERKRASETHPEKYYKFEFWSEVIAYQLGKLLGLNVLRYDVSYSEGDIGCISPEMDAADDEQLVEVGRYMTTYHPEFIPDDNQARKEYTFQLLEKTIQHFELHQYWPNFLSTIVFDAIIGNTDRHQENWAFIGSANPQETEPTKKLAREKILAEMLQAIDNDQKFYGLLNEYKLWTTNLKRMAPIYDSGSSLARELTHDRIRRLLLDEQQLNWYVDRGSAELHWERKKVSHFTLLEHVLSTRYADNLREAACFLRNWNSQYVEHLILRIDSCLPEDFADYYIPEERKELMVKLLTLRHHRVCEIIYG